MHGATPFERLRQDHRRVLAELDQLEQAAEGSEGRVRRERELRELVALLDRQFATHMKAEDDVLFPALAAALPETGGVIQPLQLEHVDLRSMLHGLDSLLDRTPGPDRDEQIAVQVRDLVDLLRIHIRKEEASVFRVAEQALPPRELTRLADQLMPGASDGPEGSPRASDDRMKGTPS